MRWVALAVMLVAATAAQAIPIDDYVSTLEAAHELMGANQLAAAKAETARIEGAEVEWSGGRFHADDTLLRAIASATRADRQLMNRIATVVNELRRSGATDSARPNPKLLQQVAEEQDVPELARGGTITTTGRGEAPMLERIAASISRMFAWLGKQIARLIDWIIDLFPRRRADGAGATAGMRWIVIAVAILIAVSIAILAFEVARRTKRGDSQSVANSEPLGSSRDEDPLSRGATEWERYAAQLAAAGRYREAIRAWYHAVLVTCYAAGVLHFRKGRTNWEYIAMLAPSVTWRPELMQLTRRFEREWYGHEQSTPEALEECSERARRILDVLRHRGAA